MLYKIDDANEQIQKSRNGPVNYGKVICQS